MVTLKYFGLSYWMNYDGTTCRFYYGPEAKGRVIIPDYVEGNGKRYKVTAFGESFEATMRQQPSDKRIKDIPIISVPSTISYGGNAAFVAITSLFDEDDPHAHMQNADAITQREITSFFIIYLRAPLI